VWKSEWWREMEAFHRIVLIPDTDPAGSQLVERLRETCPESIRERVQVLCLPDGIKDANELWQLVDADPERFREALAQCVVSQLYSGTPLSSPYSSITAPVDLAERTRRPVEWLVKDLIPARHATNLYGDSGTGKGLIVLYLALCVIEGNPLLNFPAVKRGEVLDLDLELDRDSHPALVGYRTRGRLRIASEGTALCALDARTDGTRTGAVGANGARAACVADCGLLREGGR